MQQTRKQLQQPMALRKSKWCRLDPFSCIVTHSSYLLKVVLVKCTGTRRDIDNIAIGADPFVACELWRKRRLRA
jgi:hypothetical protein